MPNIIPVTNLDHPGLQHYARLTEAQLRNRLEPDKGIFIAESPKVIRIALNAGYQPISLLTENKHLTGQAADILPRLGDCPVYAGDREVLAALTGYELTRGVLCAMRRPVLPKIGDICASAHRLVIIDSVVNSENIGAIFRAAAALSIDAALLTTTCCDPLNRRACRVSMGTVFQLPWTYLSACLADSVDQLHTLGFKLAAMALSPRAISIDDPTLQQEPRLAIVMGTEGDGLSSQTLDLCDYLVQIPMSREVDSLNVAAAAAVAFWQLRHKEDNETSDQ